MPKRTSSTQVTPEPALEKRTRRQFTPEYKLRIIAEADACKYGELGSLLRREKLYSNQLSDWRREYAVKGVAGLSKSAPGPAPAPWPAASRSRAPDFAGPLPAPNRARRPLPAPRGAP